MRDHNNKRRLEMPAATKKVAAKKVIEAECTEKDEESQESTIHDRVKKIFAEHKKYVHKRMIRRALVGAAAVAAVITVVAVKMHTNDNDIMEDEDEFEI